MRPRTNLEARNPRREAPPTRASGLGGTDRRDHCGDKPTKDRRDRSILLLRTRESHGAVRSQTKNNPRRTAQYAANYKTKPPKTKLKAAPDTQVPSRQIRHDFAQSAMPRSRADPWRVFAAKTTRCS